jgi:hypothetical protein
LLLLVVVPVDIMVVVEEVLVDLELIFLLIHYHLEYHSQYQQVQLLIQSLLVAGVLGKHMDHHQY